jgi:hypothetical protein
VSDAATHVDPPAGSHPEVPEWLKQTLSSGLIAAIVSSLLGLTAALVVPSITHSWQNHEKRIELKTALATDMSKSFTLAIGAGQRIGTGLIYSPTGDRRANAAVVQQEYNRGLGAWRIDSDRLMAELSARFPEQGIISAWNRYRFAITAYYRLSAVLPAGERPALLGGLHLYLRQVARVEAVTPAPTAIDWVALQLNTRFSTNLAFRRAYNALSASLLSLGDAYVEQLLTLQPLI